MPTRREFMRDLGALLATLLTSCCQSIPAPVPTATVMPTCYVPPPKPYWVQLRECWLDLKDASRVRDNASWLCAAHADTLGAMVASRQLDAAVAQEIGIAFDQAIEHIVQKAACYEPLPPEFAPRQDMSAQAIALAEMAQRSSIEPATVERARAALERDVAWLSQFQAGQIPDSLQTVEATPAEIEAARILVEILMNRDPFRQ